MYNANLCVGYTRYVLCARRQARRSREIVKELQVDPEELTQRASDVAEMADSSSSQLNLSNGSGCDRGVPGSSQRAYSTFVRHLDDEDSALVNCLLGYMDFLHSAASAYSSQDDANGSNIETAAKLSRERQLRL